MAQHIDKQRSLGPIETPRRVLDVILAVAAVIGVAALVLDYGFREPPLPAVALHIVQGVVFAWFIADRLLRLYVSADRWLYLRENGLEFVLMAGALVLLLVSSGLQEVLGAGALYLAVTQAYILANLILRGVTLNLRFAGAGIHPPRLLVAGFAIVILIGGGLLMLPAARPVNVSQPLNPIDALFTAVSATCVTGLIVVDTGLDWAPFGQLVILTMIQIGGLGIMMFGTMLALLMRRGLSPRESLVLGQTVGADNIGRLGTVVKFVLLVTLLFELAGAVMLYPMFRGLPGAAGVPLGRGQAAWYSVFHSISAFCNAGFSLYDGSMMEGVQENWPEPLRERYGVMGVVAPLIILGGLGFPVLQDFASFLRALVKRTRQRTRQSPGPTRSLVRARLSLHSKVVLMTSLILLVVGAAGLLAIEPASGPDGEIGRVEIDSAGGSGLGDGPDWQGLGWLRRIRASVFQSITARTAGFNTVDIGALSDASKLWMCLLMVIGGSPASTAGGMKTATFALLVLAAYSSLRNRGDTEAFRRTIAPELLRKAVTLAVLYLTLVTIVTLLLCVTMRGYTFINLLFEACSACGTVGLSTGLTPNLTWAAKFVVIIGMFAGRLGMLTLLLAAYRTTPHVEYSYPDEEVVMG